MSLIKQTALKAERLKGIQVLIVDNNDDSCYLYAVLLKDLGANVVTVGSIAEALEVLGWLLPNVLICEMRFCGESIATLTTKLSEMEAHGGDHIPVIAITTWITDSLAQVLDRGFESCLLKPIDLDQLVSLLRTLASGRSLSTPPPALKLKLRSRQKNSRRTELERCF